MEIQSLSICVPEKACINNCKFCVSRQHCEDYETIYDKAMIHDIDFADIDMNEREFECYNKYSNAISFARDNGCNTLMLTGACEPQQNLDFIRYITNINRTISNGFRWIEIQTTGRNLTDKKLDVLKKCGVNTIALSISSLNSVENDFCLGIEDIDHISISDTCKRIKNKGFNLRLCLNLTFGFERYIDKLSSLFNKCKELGANQITFRELYAIEGTKQAEWIKEYKCSWPIAYYIEKYVKDKESVGEARLLRTLPNGIKLYGMNGMSIAIDTDCMENVKRDALRYLVLRQDGHLYTDWTDEASLLY